MNGVSTTPSRQDWPRCSRASTPTTGTPRRPHRRCKKKLRITRPQSGLASATNRSTVTTPRFLNVPTSGVIRENHPCFFAEPTEFLVLSILDGPDRHGYELAQIIEARSGERRRVWREFVDALDQVTKIRHA